MPPLCCVDYSNFNTRAQSSSTLFIIHSSYYKSVCEAFLATEIRTDHRLLLLQSFQDEVLGLVYLEYRVTKPLSREVETNQIRINCFICAVLIMNKNFQYSNAAILID